MTYLGKIFSVFFNFLIKFCIYIIYGNFIMTHLAKILSVFKYLVISWFIHWFQVTVKKFSFSAVNKQIPISNEINNK